MNECEDLIKKKTEADKHFKEEIKFQTEEVTREETYGLIDAFSDILDNCDENYFKSKECRAVKELVLQMGIARKVTDEELKNIIHFGSGKKYWFIHKGDKCIFDKSLEEACKKN